MIHPDLLRTIVVVLSILFQPVSFIEIKSAFVLFASGSSCVCEPGYRMVASNGGFSVTCEKCPENMVSIECFMFAIMIKY